MPQVALQTLIALATIGNFLLIFGYFVFFETLWSGQTPGKRWMGLRVICDDGRPVTFFQAMVRNLIRLVDIMPVAAVAPSYFVGILSIFISAKNRRLGDLAAGTVVVRERRWETPILEKWYQAIQLAKGKAETIASDHASNRGQRISPSSFDLVTTFLSRRDQLEPAIRAHWAERIRQKIEAEMGESEWSRDLTAEKYLETLHRMFLVDSKYSSN